MFVLLDNFAICSFEFGEFRLLNLCQVAAIICTFNTQNANKILVTRL